MSNTSRETKRGPLFPATCLSPKASHKCEPEEGRAAFLISDEAIKRLTSGNEGGGGSARRTKAVIESQEQEWRIKERCIDDLHAKKVGMDEASILALEKHWLKQNICSGGGFDIENKPLYNCYQANMITPLKCRGLVMDYLQTVAKYRQQLFFTTRN